MPLVFRPFQPQFVAEVTGIDLRAPPDEALCAEITAAADRYAVLIFPNQRITDAQHIAFSHPFGRLETTIKTYRPGFQARLPAEVADISNLDETANILPTNDRRRRMSALGNRLWHTDYTFKPTPGLYSLLSAHGIPREGGQTQFTDLRAAYDALPERMKSRIDGLIAEHSQLYSRGTIGFTDFSPEETSRLGSAPQPLVRVHPGSKRKILYLASHAMLIHGMDIREGRILLADLMDHATRPEFAHTHDWTEGDMVLSDNRRTMHRACAYNPGDIRDLHRTKVMEPTLPMAELTRTPA